MSMFSSMIVCMFLRVFMVFCVSLMLELLIEGHFEHFNTIFFKNVKCKMEVDP